MIYICYYSCPHCPNPCTFEDPDTEANELVDVNSKREARELFQSAKQCRWMKLKRIEACQEKGQLMVLK